MDTRRHLGDRDGTQRGDFLMWHDYLGLRATLARLARADDVTDPQSPGFETRTWRSDVSPVSSSARSPQSPGGGGGGGGGRGAGERTVCGFCRQNGESPEIYTSHRLKARNGRVLCPVLRRYVCPICGATGDTAHTRHYCPTRDLHRV